MNNYYRNLIANEFEDCVNRTILWINSGEHTNHPFHSALLSDEIIYWSAFERSFSTSFGQRVIEEIAELVALSNGATTACRQKETYINLDVAYEEAIHNHIQSLRDNTARHRDWDSSLNEVLSVHPAGQIHQLRIISDVWWEKDGIEHYISLKTVKPNIDQTCVAKEDCLKLSVAIPNSRTYFGLPYNPFGENKQSYAFHPPMNIFDFHNDSVVLIGKDMWDTIGGKGCYDELLNIAYEVGLKTKEAIEISQSQRIKKNYI